MPDGDIFFDVKIYNTADIINLGSRERSDKWAANLRLRVSPDDPLWKELKKLCAEAKKRFSKEAMYYGDKVGSQ